MDYYNERQRLSFGESIKSVRNKKGIAIGNGTIFSMIFMIPVIGVTISTVTCTVAATIALDKEKESGKLA